jgi:hypothetical protein
MVLLLIAGAQKLIAPSSTSGAMRAAGLPGSFVVVRALGLSEIIVAGAFLVLGGGLPALGGALLYAGFAGFVGFALFRNIPLQSCGCLGSADTPPTWVHFVVNVLAMAVLVVAGIIPIGPLGGLVGQEVRTVIPFVLFTGVAVYLLYALLTVLPMVSNRAISRLPTPLGLPSRRAE